MVKITKSGKQYRVNIPIEVIHQTGWDEKHRAKHISIP